MVPNWTHMNQVPNGLSIGSAVFAQHIRMINTQTDRHTDHATCDCATSSKTAKSFTGIVYTVQ